MGRSMKVGFNFLPRYFNLKNQHFLHYYHNKFLKLICTFLQLSQEKYFYLFYLI